VPSKELTLPEPKQFEAIVQAIETAGARQSKDCADLVRFLAYSGCRLGEAHQVLWSDIDFDRGEVRIRNGKRRRTSGAQIFRLVPMIVPMREMLERMHAGKKHEPGDRVCVLDECGKSLASACGVKDGKRMTKIKRGKTVECGIGIEVISHHDLRHLFATRCIESGVDIPTVSRWLGHNDGGVLAMKTYGHLRREHSQAMAQRVTFGTAATPPVSNQVSNDAKTCAAGSSVTATLEHAPERR
jgi:integrase